MHLECQKRRFYNVGYGEASEKGQGEAVVPGKAALLSSAQGQNMDKQNGSKANIQTPTQENHSRNGTPKSLLSPSRRKASSMPWLDGGPARLRSVTPLISRLLDYMATPDVSAMLECQDTLPDASPCVLFLLEVDQYLKESNVDDIEASARRLLRKYFSEDCASLHLSPWLRACGDDAVVGAVNALESAQDPERVQNVKDDAEMIKTSLVWVAEFIEKRLAKQAYPLFSHSAHCPRNINVHRKPREHLGGKTSGGADGAAVQIAVAFRGKQILAGTR